MARIVVVGGGVIGTLHAYLAVRAGHEVAQLEREPEARGASVRNFGLIWVSGRRPGDELELALRARTLWEEVAADVPAIGFRANGSLTIAQLPEELRVLEQVAACADAVRRGFALLGPREVREVNPALRGKLLAALHCRRDAAIEPRRVLPALRAAIEATGRYRWLPETHVVEIDDDGARDHRGERYPADLTLLCPGAAHRPVAGWEPGLAPLRRVRLQMLETEPAPFALDTSVADGDSLRYYPAFDVPALAELPAPAPIVAEQHMQLLVQQRLDGRLTVGDTHEYDEPFDVAVADEPYRHLAERIESIVGVPLPPIRRRWAGVYSQALDDRLYHREQIADTAWVVTGAGGRGMTCAPAIAEQTLAEVGALDGAAV
jgi:FAD dependent oxidoreductase TIGR03364